MPDSPTATKPNVIIIMVDDLGFSDVGCYGGEISTPNIDALGTGGVRFTQMYNGARCCPSRAALLTGLHPHQAGIGQMSQDLGYSAYQGFLNQSSVTIAEVMGQSGYRTLMSGKWHVGGSYDARSRDEWNPGDETHPMPTQRGFDRYFGLLEAADSFWNPKSLTLQETLIKNESQEFHLTDAIAEHAANQIDESIDMGKSFFQYVAFTAPHWPLHAWEEDIAKYEGRYMQGWDAIRTARHEEMKGLGIIDPKWPISARDEDSPPWESVANKNYEDIKMATYSAMIEQVDRGVGRIVETLKSRGEFENSLIMFLSDNGGCAELFQEDDDWGEASQWETEPTLEGLPVRVGNLPELRPGPDTTFQAVELPWANVSDTPFRLFKRWIHEGGITTPFIVHWPSVIDGGQIRHEPMQIIDIAATIYDVGGAAYPTEFSDHAITPIEGESFLAALTQKAWAREKPIFVEHEGNRGVRMGDWKLVAEWEGPWELYNMADDRTELNDLAESESARLASMQKTYFEWAEHAGVREWPVLLSVVAKRLKGKHAHISQHRRSPLGDMR